MPDGGTERRVRAGLASSTAGLPGPAPSLGGWLAGTLVGAAVLVLVAAVVLGQVAAEILGNQRDERRRGCALLALQHAPAAELDRLGCP